MKIISTLGPSTINKKFLNFASREIDLIRLNMSHLSINKLERNIKFIKKNCTTPICIDTEGAQIRTKVKKIKNYKNGSIINIGEKKGNFILYPSNVFKSLKINDILNIGFDGLLIKINKCNKKRLKAKVIRSGKLENNKGVHLENRKLKLNFLTEKDFQAIKIGKKYSIKNFALSFTSSVKDIKKFNKLLKIENKIFKIETKNAVKNFNKIIKYGNNFLIDRGDLSKEISIENIPVAQRVLFKIKKKFKNKNIYVATNLLESMILNNLPTRGEANDIFNSLEMGADGLVLAAETAIGKNPIDCVNFLKKILNTYKLSKLRLITKK
jgi:pyruvate kinase